MEKQIVNDHLYKLKKEDIPGACFVLAKAFQQDVSWKKVFANILDTEQKLHTFFEIPLRYCFKYGEVVAPSEKLEGIAAWVPGRLSYSGLIRMLLCGTLPMVASLGKDFNSKIMPIFKPIDKDRRTHMKGKRYTYLNIIGVDPDHQGKGYCSKMMGHLLRRCDTSHEYIYLETSTKTNLSIYRKYGFSVVKELHLPQIDEIMWEMIWAPESDDR